METTCKAPKVFWHLQRIHLIFPTQIVTTCVKYCLLGLIWDLVVRLFLGVWWHNHPLPSTDPAFRLPEGKQVFIHQGVCTNNSGTVSHPQLFWKLANPSWNSGLMPAKDPHSKQAFVRIADSCLFCECLCTERFSHPSTTQARPCLASEIRRDHWAIL